MGCTSSNPTKAEVEEFVPAVQEFEQAAAPPAVLPKFEMVWSEDGTCFCKQYVSSLNIVPHPFTLDAPPPIVLQVQLSRDRQHGCTVGFARRAAACAAVYAARLGRENHQRAPVPALLC
jgi:hypothetical protein